MKKQRFFLIVLLACVALMSGCGTKTDGQTEESGLEISELLPLDNLTVMTGRFDTNFNTDSSGNLQVNLVPHTPGTEHDGFGVRCGSQYYFFNEAETIILPPEESCDMDLFRIYVEPGQKYPDHVKRCVVMDVTLNFEILTQDNQSLNNAFASREPFTHINGCLFLGPPQVFKTSEPSLIKINTYSPYHYQYLDRVYVSFWGHPRAAPPEEGIIPNYFQDFSVFYVRKSEPAHYAASVSSEVMDDERSRVYRSGPRTTYFLE